MTERYCVDCKHFGCLGDLFPLEICAAPGNRYDPVTGKVKLLTCALNRFNTPDMLANLCGPAAKHSEPKLMTYLESPSRVSPNTRFERLISPFLKWKTSDPRI